MNRAHKALNLTALIRPSTNIRTTIPFATKNALAFRNYTTTTTDGSKDKNAGANTLTWNQFFDVRRRRRIYEKVATIPSTVLSLTIGGGYFSTITLDVSKTFMGLDPLLIFSGATMFCGAIGFVSGPTIGRYIWGMMNKKQAKLVESKEVEFFEHIKANRSNPAFNSPRNPLPDYYGEKILSLRDYRKWLRKQRDHERKGTFHMGLKK
ncbi:TIM23 complex component [Mycoemilia scoparia]|uniref:Presequence translocated-associated motor subunit PAM17 n=1 Tax=Mycoemilia scoparia TaxID=417184 RepID=A0A9W8A180_9FUNG|nr:TIM23 complex component [Mycoemilia scoparia]